MHGFPSLPDSAQRCLPFVELHRTFLHYLASFTASVGYKFVFRCRLVAFLFNERSNPQYFCRRIAIKVARHLKTNERRKREVVGRDTTKILGIYILPD